MCTTEVDAAADFLDFVTILPEEVTIGKASWVGILELTAADSDKTGRGVEMGVAGSFDVLAPLPFSAG